MSASPSKLPKQTTLMADMSGSNPPKTEVEESNAASNGAANPPDGTYPTIPDFRGEQWPRPGEGGIVGGYAIQNTVYASSSYQKEHDMYPGLIIKPLDDQDVARAIKYARTKQLKISIMSGGHQYSGACSTSGPNIMMNLADTYAKDGLSMYEEDNHAMVRVSVSQSIEAFNTYLRQNHVFVPHGQCSTVHTGGHVQTGGYGNLARGFGLLGDHVRKIRLFDHEARLKEITRDSPDEADRRLFSAILGGSPGNFGVITHYHIQVYRDADYQFGDVTPYFFWGFSLYNKTTLRKCLAKVAEMADNPDFPRNYDLCVSVHSSTVRLFSHGPDQGDGIQLPDLKPGSDIRDEAVDPDPDDDDDPVDAKLLDALDALNAEPDGKDLAKGVVLFPVIAVYAQWVPFSKDDKYDPKWFSDLIEAAPPRYRIRRMYLHGPSPVSSITELWLFKAPREFDYPYEKRAYLTTSTSLGKDNWVDTVTNRIQMVVRWNLAHLDLWNNCFLSVQIQCFGGLKSKFTTNRDNGTSYSWRDSTVVQVLDCFYRNNRKDLALGWQAQNDKIMKGKGSVFGEQDRRVLWASYGDWDMKNSWKYYYEDESKYKKLGQVRGAADPEGTFTANPFAVEAVSC